MSMMQNSKWWVNCTFAACPIVKLNLEEHQEAQWITIPEALKLPLIAGGKEGLKYYREFIEANK
jgi:hypothetical protein